MLTQEIVPHGRGAELGELFGRLGLTAFGAEIGVQGGVHAAAILSAWPGVCLFLIDPWKQQSLENYKDSANVANPEHERRLANCRKRMAPHADRCVIHRSHSVEAAERFPDNCLDWAYIDANHSFEAVSADVRAWWPKVRQGGILCGHDYVDGDQSAKGGGNGLYGVKSAVDQWAKRLRLPILTTGDGQNWLVQKPITLDNRRPAR